MVHSIAGALSVLKRQKRPLQILQPGVIRELFRQCGHTWRDRMLEPATTMELFTRQILEGNVACARVRQMADGQFTASAYAQARARLPAAAVWRTAREVTAQVNSHRQPRWNGHRTLLVDGTGFSMPDTPELQAAFGQPGMQKPGCGFPVAHLLVLFDAATGMALEAWPAPLRTHDLKDIARVHEHLRAGDVLLGDEAFGSWTHLAMLQGMGVHGVFPMHHARTPLDGDSFDRIERWPKPNVKPVWITPQQYAALPEVITVRLIRRRVRVPGRKQRRTITLVTTLLDRRRYPARQIVELAAARWQAETDLRHLKITLKLDVLRCKTVTGIVKELAAMILVYNLVRAVMLRAAARQGTPVRRISFADALGWLNRADATATLYDLIVNPQRQRRSEPRVVKRRIDKYPRMTRPREQLRKSLKYQAHAA
jgi:hypothetical protein